MDATSCLAYKGIRVWTVEDFHGEVAFPSQLVGERSGDAADTVRVHTFNSNDGAANVWFWRGQTRSWKRARNLREDFDFIQHRNRHDHRFNPRTLG